MMSRSSGSRTAAIELILVMGSAAVVYGLGLLFHIPALGLFSVAAAWLVAWMLLRKRGVDWRLLGLFRPDKTGRTLGLVFTGVLAVHGLVRGLKPLIRSLTGRPLDIGLFEGLRGDTAALAGGLLVVWSFAAFGEEMVFRGFLLNRLADLFPRLKLRWILAVAGSSLIFGLGHVYQGINGVILASLVGVVYCTAYFLDKRCLWAPILIHGFYDTSALLLIYSDLDRLLSHLS